MPNLIKVQAGPSLLPGKVALWEPNEDHPGEDHEAFIVAGRDPVEVAETPKVIALLADQTLVKADEKNAQTQTSEQSRTSGVARS